MPDAAVHQAEAALLSAVLTCEDAILLATEFVRPEYFRDLDHRRIFQGCLEVHRLGIPVDITTVAQRVQDGNGIMTRLAELLTVPAISANVEHYGRIVREGYLKREALKIADGLSDKKSGSEVIAEIGNRLRKLEVVGDAEGELEPFLSGDRFNEVLESVTSKDNWSTDVFPSTIGPLDTAIMGFQCGTTTKVEAVYKSGKTKLLTQILIENARRGTPVGFISLEMSEARVARWILSYVCRIDSQFFRAPFSEKWTRLYSGGQNLRDGYVDRVKSAEDEVHQLPLYVEYRTAPTIQELQALISAMVRRGIKLIGIDYFDRIRKPSTDWNDEAIITSGLADAATRNAVALIYLDQRNKVAIGSKAMDHTGSRGSISRNADADTILTMKNLRATGEMRSGIPDHIADIDVLVVQRDGTSGTKVELRADLATGHFGGREDNG